MTITRIAQSGPAAATSGALNVTQTTPAAGNRLVLTIFALAAQTMPTTVTGYTKVGSDVTLAGFVAATFTKVAAGTETGALSILTATTASIAWITEYNGSTVTPSIVVGYGGDTQDMGDGLTTLATAGMTTVAGDWIVANTVWAASSPSFPTAPAARSGAAITQSGATLGTITNRAGTTWATNHRYNLADIPVTTGASTAPLYGSNGITTNLRGITQFVVLTETAVAVPATVTPDPASIVISATAPGLSAEWSLSAPTPSFPITPVAPLVLRGRSMVTGTASVPPTPVAPALIANVAVTPAPGTASVPPTPVAPAVTAARTLVVPAADAAPTPQPPAVMGFIASPWTVTVPGPAIVDIDPQLAEPKVFQTKHPFYVTVPITPVVPVIIAQAAYTAVVPTVLVPITHVTPRVGAYRDLKILGTTVPVGTWTNTDALTYWTTTEPGTIATATEPLPVWTTTNPSTD